MQIPLRRFVWNGDPAWHWPTPGPAPGPAPGPSLGQCRASAGRGMVLHARKNVLMFWPRTEKDSVPSITKGQTALIGGNLVTSGGSVILLVTALQVLGQHGEEFLSVRRHLDQLTNDLQRTTHAVDARLIRVEIQQKDIVEEQAVLQRLMTDAKTRPDAWTRTDDMERMMDFERDIKSWVRNFTIRIKTNGQIPSAPLSIQNLMEIQKAITRLNMDESHQWTKEGKPRVTALESILGRRVSSRDRDSAWTMMQTSRSLAPGKP